MAKKPVKDAGGRGKTRVTDAGGRGKTRKGK